MPWYEWWCVWFFSDTNRGRQTKTEKAEKPNKSVQVRASFGRISFVPDCIQQSVSISRLIKSEHWSCLGLSIYAFRHVLHLICSRIFIQRHMFLLWKCLGTKRQFRQQFICWKWKRQLYARVSVSETNIQSPEKKCGGLFVYFIKRFSATNHCYAQIIFNCSNGLFNWIFRLSTKGVECVLPTIFNLIFRWIATTK